MVLYGSKEALPSRNLFCYQSQPKEAIEDRKRGTILGRMEISRPLHQKAKILWQLENLQNYKDLYGKPLERYWRAKRLLLIQILLISNAHKNPPLKRYKPENLNVSLFGTVLSISDNIMHYQ